MMLKRFRGRIKLPTGSQEVTIQADNLHNARAMLEAQYGPGSVLHLSEMLTGE